MNVRWAITEIINYPPKGFEEVVRLHFWLKREEICHQIEEWIRETQQSISDPNQETTKSLPFYLSGLKVKNIFLYKSFKYVILRKTTKN